MKSAALAIPLLLAAADPQPPSRPSANLALFSDLQTSAWQEGWRDLRRMPPGLDWRLRKVRKRLTACYGEAAVEAADEASDNAYREFLGTFDPVGRRPTFDELLAEQHDAYSHYSAQLAALERALMRGC